MIKRHCKKHSNHECLAIVIIYHVFNKFLKKKRKDLPLKFGYFHFSVSSSTFLTVSWLVIFASVDSSRTVLSIDGSEPRLESYTRGKIRITSKNNKNFDVFCYFWLNQIQNFSGRVKKIKDGIFSFQLKRITFAER